MAESSPLNLLDLPVDILTMIVQYLVLTPDEISMCPCATNASMLSESESLIRQLPPLYPYRLLDVLLIHPFIHAIACPLFYSGNTFVLHLDGKHTRHIRYLYEPINSASKDSRHMPRDDSPDRQPRFPALLRCDNALRRIRRVRVRVDRVRGFIEKIAMPPLEEMVLSGSLSSLDVVVVGHLALLAFYQAGGFYADSIMSKPLLVRIILLLGDPYLREARLRVLKSHAPSWCEYHRGRWCPQMPLDSKENDSISRNVLQDHGNGNVEYDESGEELMDMDWRAMLSVIDPEGVRVPTLAGEN